MLHVDSVCPLTTIVHTTTHAYTGNSDGMKLAAEYLRCFTIEAAFRASQQAKMEGSDQVWALMQDSV